MGGLWAAARGGRTATRAWICLTVLALIGWGIASQRSGVLWCAVAFAVAGILVPVRMYAHARRRAAVGDYAGAARWAERLVHLRIDPLFSRWRAAWLALDAWCHGQEMPARDLIVQWSADAGTHERALREWLLAATRQWEMVRYASVLELSVVALCELGEIERGVETTARGVGVKRLRLGALSRLLGLMLAPFAFCGRVAVVERLTGLLRLPDSAGALWRATAEAAAGRPEKADSTLRALLERRDLTPGLRLAVTHRLAHLPAPAPILGPSAEDVLRKAKQEIDAIEIVRFRPSEISVSVYVVLAGMTVGFVLQAAYGGTTDPWVALRLGALYVQGQLPTDLWRLAAYGMLHHGPMHLLVNGLAVVLVGPVVVRGLGAAGFIGVFVGSVILAGVAISLLGSPGLTVGASAGAVGLLGALGAMALFKPRVRGTRTAQFVARAVLVLVLLQAGLDTLVPNLSFVGHLSGALAGCALATPIALAGRGRRAAPAQSIS